MSADDYVCTLDNASIKKAREELNENPQDRLAAVQALRDWVKAQPHIKCPEPDTLRMLWFLRGAKFSQIRAREMLEGNLSLKFKAPEAFLNIDSHDPKILDLLNTQYVAILPKRTPNGCQVILYRMAQILKRKDMDITFMWRAGGIIVHYLSQSELTQVNGAIFLMDFTGVTAKFMSKIMNNDMQKFQKLFQSNTPGRFKGFHYYNCGLVFETMMTFARPFLPKKWLDRIRTHETMETVYEVIPKHCLPVEYLPDDYKGEHAGSLADIIQNFIKEVKEPKFRDELLKVTSKAYSIDQSQKPEAVTSHFRKLNVD